ncbi:SusC/RagA family TonB-linked outer membrane protein [Flavobacterium salilacus subsp. salilacus]|uniref:SusC/RagA family TonB-linked outer membrane protein n=1 Tax=Flavobacterium TaxID=237 RepID=UPI001074B9D1|nr:MULTISPECIES: SusC/RagA family TonB-linked outer membrane protein [Flavobacterium]KAF2519979.1 SusC/RagA family TonB-linked outer membrane protein [Flavobacterium salilacus subsp. salilacus]MBE1614108.1 SusC/RagA family TonB-linked outer membrane protein [Flavobacterium sp. SaA2.13]
MRKTLLNISFCLVGAAAFAQVPPTPLDSIPNDSIFFENQMQEVILIGYGTKKAGAITGSVAQIKADDIVRTPAQSPIQAIQGRAAGVNIVTNDEPGATPTIRIRGLGTLIGGRDPLYVVDGIETSNITGLNPNDIDKIDILKDASSLAIYGQKGANGVVLITTKKGKRGDVKINYSGYYGQKFIQRDVEMADSYRYAYYNNTALGSSSYFSFDQPYNTNWLDEITDTGEVMNNTISIAGAGENSSYYFSASNYKEEGILNGSKYERTNIISKNEFRMLDDKLKISPFFNLSSANTTPKPLSAFTNAYKQSPIMPVRYPNGRWGAPLVNEDGVNDLTGDRYNNVANPAAQLYYFNEKNKNVMLIGSIKAELELLDYLTVTSNFGATSEWARGYSFTPTRELWLASNPTSTVEDYIAQNPENPIVNTLQQRRSTNYRWNWDNYITFSKYFGDHNVTAVAGMSRSTYNISEYLNATRFDVPEQSNYWNLNLSSNNVEVAPGSVVQNNSGTPIVSVAYFGRAEYEYKRKYLFSASVRREGISTFQGDNKYAIFPAVSAGWVVTDEDFMNNVKFLDHLKIRGGYGEVGNGNSLALNAILFNVSNYPFGPDQVINPGLNNPGQIDRNLSWETMKEFDLGIDFATLQNRLTGTIDLYDRKNEDIILPISVPPVLSPEPVFLNSGVVTNQGVEVSLKWQDRIGDNINYWIGGNFSYNKNELKEVYNQELFGDYIGGGLGNGQYTKQVLVGQPLGSFYVYETTGFNSDGAFTYSDQRVVAGSYLPTATYGINLGLTYKGIDFSVDAYGVGGNKLYNGKKAQRFGGENVEYDILDSFYTPSTPNASNPKPSNDVPRASTYYVENGDYLRINNITLGYTIPLDIKGIDRVRLYATAINPFLFTNYSGFSPELSGNNNGDPLGTAGIELDAYPTNKSYLFGLNIDF